ncbi:MAG: ABC transporter permease [Clostridiales bacterium]|nr:MAG: ABC transporter permease [Clostridiales bacterium]
MSIKQSLTLAVKSLMGSKMRSFLTMLGIIIGVGAVIIIVGVINGMTQMVMDEFESMGATNIIVSVRGRGGNRSIDIDDMQKSCGRKSGAFVGYDAVDKHFGRSGEIGFGKS